VDLVSVLRLIKGVGGDI
jgi:hypothetical protein